MAKKLSDGFAGGWTRQAGDALKEIESRMSKLDVFTDQFSPPAFEESPGKKTDASFNQAKHDDLADTAQLPSMYKAPVQKSLAAAGIASDQEMLDEVDETERHFNIGIKPMKDQFPTDSEDKFYRNEHGLKKGKKMNSNDLDKRIEKKMKHLAKKNEGDGISKETVRRIQNLTTLARQVHTAYANIEHKAEQYIDYASEEGLSESEAKTIVDDCEKLLKKMIQLRSEF